MSATAEANPMLAGLRSIIRALLTVAAFSLLFSYCQRNDSSPAAAADPEARKIECFENEPPLFYDEAGTCYSQDPFGLTAAQRAQYVITPTARGGDSSADRPLAAPVAPGGGPVAPGGGPVAPGGGPVAPGGGPVAPGGGPVAPGSAATPIDPRSAAAKPPAAPAAPSAPGGAATPGGGGAAVPGAAPAPGGNASAPTPGNTNAGATPAAAVSPSLGYIEEDGRTAEVTEGPVVTGFQVWVHAPSKTLYADSCEVLTPLVVEGAEFGPTETEDGYGIICPDF